MTAHRRGRRLLATGVLLGALLAVTGAAVATAEPELTTSGEGSVVGTPASGVFIIGDRTIRQIRYVDGGTLAYTFTVENAGWRPLTVTGLEAPDPQPRLFELQRVVDDDGDEEVTVPPRGEVRLTVEMLMRGCETLSARAGSIVSEVELVLDGAGTELVSFPEEIRAGSPREAGCADATASSRSPG